MKDFTLEVANIKENDDGSMIISFDMDDFVAKALLSEYIRQILIKAANDAIENNKESRDDNQMNFSFY